LAAQKILAGSAVVIPLMIAIVMGLIADLDSPRPALTLNPLRTDLSLESLCLSSYF
jgi:hypothetical protein